MTSSPRFIAIVDDDEVLRTTLAAVLNSVQLNCRCYGSAAAFLDEAGIINCDCLVLDLRMPGISGLELQRRLCEQAPELPVIFISGHGDIESAVRAMKQGAFDFLRKPFSNQTFIDTVQTALDRTTAQHHKETRRQSLKQPLQVLTAREREVFSLLGKGKMAKEVAQELGLCLKTVEEHRSNILKKLALRRTAELVVLATELRLLQGTELRLLQGAIKDS